MKTIVITFLTIISISCNTQKPGTRIYKSNLKPNLLGGKGGKGGKSENGIDGADGEDGKNKILNIKL